jgi:CRISPR-associated protein Cmr5
MKNIEKMIPTAITAVEKEVLVPKEAPKEVPKEFNGYISSFGASIIMSGLLPTIVFFSQEGKSKGDRRSVITALEMIVNKHYPELLTKDQKLIPTLKEMVESNKSTQRLQDKLQEAAIALKLAIRIFPKSKTESDHE